MLQYFTPTTLEEMYKDVDETRLDLLRGVNSENLFDRIDEYRKLTNLLEKIDYQYKALTGNDLWTEVILTSA